MNEYTITLTAAQGGRHAHVFHRIEAATPQEAIVTAYRERYGDHVSVTTRDVHARGRDISDRAFHVVGTAGAITFADVIKHDDKMSPTMRAVVNAGKVRDAAVLAAYEAEGTRREAEMDAACEKAEAAYREAQKAHRAARAANGDRV